jgi:hypothetical protein
LINTRSIARTTQAMDPGFRAVVCGFPPTLDYSMEKL